MCEVGVVLYSKRGVACLIPIFPRLLLLTLGYGSQTEGQLDVHSVPLSLLFFIIGLILVFVLVLGVAVMRGGVQGG